jgi:hypothetical protein
MKSIRARLAALLAGYLLAILTTHGLAEATPELAAHIQAWVDHTFELVLFVGYAVVHPWIQKRWNPTGAYTTEAAHKLEHVAHVERAG